MNNSYLQRCFDRAQREYDNRMPPDNDAPRKRRRRSDEEYDSDEEPMKEYERKEDEQPKRLCNE